MRRGPGGLGGKAALLKQQQLKQQYESKGDEIQAVKLQEALKICQDFQRQLAEFANKHREKINKDPKFRNAFHEMCLATGVDPLQSSRTQKNFWGSGGGVSLTFYADLGVQILTHCMLTRPANGGLLHVRELIGRLRKNRKAEVSSDDILRAVEMLTKSLGPGVAVRKLGGVRVVSSVPEELDVDQNLALLVAAKNGGWISVEMLGRAERTDGLGLAWEKGRAERVCVFFVREGLCWVDRCPGKEETYWFPSIALGGVETGA